MIGGDIFALSAFGENAPDAWSLPVFPPADVFPMLPDDELAELAADIRENGLREPLVIATIDGVDVLVDGRNRRAACKIAGVTPTTRRLAGEDPTAYVVSANIHRRNLTQSQKAMTAALIYPAPEKGGRGKNSFVAKEFSAAQLSKARTVLDWSRSVALAVRDGVRPLDDAYAEALAAKKAAAADAARLATMRAEAPELADLVVEARMTVADAWAAFEERQQLAKGEANQREWVVRLADAGYRATVAWANNEFVEGARSDLKDETFRKEFIDRLRLRRDEVELMSEGAKHLISVLSEVVDEIERRAAAVAAVPTAGGEAAPRNQPPDQQKDSLEDALRIPPFLRRPAT